MRFLIADDNAPFRRMVRDLLNEGFQPGAEIQECSDGRAAVDAYEAKRPDWVIMDIEMSAMDGLEATRRIVRRDPQARVLVLTLHAGEEIRTAAYEAGALDFLAKDRLGELCGRLSATRRA